MKKSSFQFNYGSGLLHEKPIRKEILIENYLIEVLGEKSDLISDHILILMKKCPENEYGYIDKTNKNCKISKDEAMNILEDIGKWEDFIFVTKNVLEDLGINHFHITYNKNINIRNVVVKWLKKTIKTAFYLTHLRNYG